MITNTWKVFYSTTTDENDGVLLKIVTLTTDVGDDLVTVSKTNLSNFPKSGVWLLWGAGVVQVVWLHQDKNRLLKNLLLMKLR